MRWVSISTRAPCGAAIQDFCIACVMAQPMANQDCQKACTFSWPMVWNSRRSRALGTGPASAMRVRRCATTWGTARASSEAWRARRTDLRREEVMRPFCEPPAPAVSAVFLNRRPGGPLSSTVLPSGSATYMEGRAPPHRNASPPHQPEPRAPAGARGSPRRPRGPRAGRSGQCCAGRTPPARPARCRPGPGRSGRARQLHQADLLVDAVHGQPSTSP